MKNKSIGLIISLIVLSVFISCSKIKINFFTNKKAFSREQEYIHEFGIFSKRTSDKFRLHLDNKQNTPIEMIGWSKNGLFACRYRNDDDWYPAKYSLVIFDTVNNKIIEEDAIIIVEGLIGIVEEKRISFFYDEDERPDLIGYTANFNNILGEYRAKWEELLKKHDIIGRVDDVLSSNFQTDLLDFPIDNYSCWYDYVIKTDNNKSINSKKRTDIIKWKLMIGNDTIQEIICANDSRVNYDFIIGSKILGYYKSPYENKIVVVTSYYRYIGYSEADTILGIVNLFGYNLDKIGIDNGKK